MDISYFHYIVTSAYCKRNVGNAVTSHQQDQKHSCRKLAYHQIFTMNVFYNERFYVLYKTCTVSSLLFPLNPMRTSIDSLIYRL